jgi:hypothetical protein
MDLPTIDVAVSHSSLCSHYDITNRHYPQKRLGYVLDSTHTSFLLPFYLDSLIMSDVSGELVRFHVNL